MDLSNSFFKAKIDQVRKDVVGKSLTAVNVPAAIIDRAVVKRNCDQMLAMCEKVGVGFRAHIKTHKTVEATELMMGGPSAGGDINLVVSTTLELRHILAWLETQQKAGRRVNVLYGIPLPPSEVSNLLEVAKVLGNEAVSVMIDHPDQLDALQAARLNPRAFIKIDTGYGRAGVPHTAESPSLKTLLQRMKEAQDGGYVEFQGFYSHGGDVYGVNSFQEAFAVLGREISGLGDAAKIGRDAGVSPGPGQGKGYVLSAGATPSISVAWMNADPEAQDGAVPKVIKELTEAGHTVEFHAGNYPILDMQQIATSAGVTSALRLPSAQQCAPRALSDLAFTVLAEVNSVYTEREAPERLITAGCLALGREPCKSYPGWGVISDWPRTPAGPTGGLPEASGWYVHSISQEHGRLRQGSVPGVPAPKNAGADWKVGGRVRVWPNHACITAANFSCFYVVDGGDESKGEKIVDIWARCIGW